MELFKNFKDLWRGVALALVISVPAWLLGKQFEVIGGPVFAILIGMALGRCRGHQVHVEEDPAVRGDPAGLRPQLGRNR